VPKTQAAQFHTQLNNTHDDPPETKDVSTQHPEVVNERRALLIRRACRVIIPAMLGVTGPRAGPSDGRNRFRATFAEGGSSFTTPRQSDSRREDQRPYWDVTQLLVNMGRLLPLGAYASKVQTGNVALERFSKATVTRKPG
jgi:hypothetical protein